MARFRILMVAGWLLAGMNWLAARPPAPPAANLRGQVMILVYHKFAAVDGCHHKAGVSCWTRSFSDFDQDLDRLEAAGYRPITLRQYVSGDFALPAGTTPVVLTFDDSSDNQMKFAPDGQLSPDCAVAHWVAFAKAHPDFPVHGVFFVNPGDDAFSQRAFQQKKLEMLVGLGSEIGNHTWDHPNFHDPKLTPAATEREIGLGQYQIEQWLPGYKVVSFALPYGVSARPETLAFAGQWTGPAPGRAAAPVTETWDYKAVVKVGSGPAPSPLVAGFDGDRLPRIQMFDPEFDTWLEYFAKHPGRRFVSDGAAHPPASLPRAAAAPPRAR